MDQIKAGGINDKDDGGRRFVLVVLMGHGCLKSGGGGGIDGIRGGGNCGSSGLRCPRSDDGGGNKNGRREAYL